VCCSAITRGTDTRLLVNDRADIARAAHADGVHLTTRSIEAHIIRHTFGPDFLIGVSTHTLAEARAARDGGADFVVFGPIFDTESKRAYVPPVGIESLREAAQSLTPFPLLALGGVTIENAPDVFSAGAKGVAAIRLFSNTLNISQIVRSLQSQSKLITLGETKRE
jgi:thiamine-phosphate pyrophosphorylase